MLVEPFNIDKVYCFISIINKASRRWNTFEENLDDNSTLLDFKRMQHK
jgi:hypothetical protein